jgi:hypothetical protein
MISILILAILTAFIVTTVILFIGAIVDDATNFYHIKTPYKKKESLERFDVSDFKPKSYFKNQKYDPTNPKADGYGYVHGGKK